MSVTLRGAGLFPLRHVIPVGVYLVLVLLGVTQSSIGIDSLREDPSAPHGTMFGEPQVIRSDEFVTATPTDIGVTATGSTETLNPLTAPQAFFATLPAGPVSSLVLFDGTALQLGPVLPDQMLIAARWWLPFLLLVLGAPPFFKTLTGSSRIGYFAAALIAFSPASAWWSFTPVRILGFALAGAALLQLCGKAAVARRWWPAAGYGVLSAVLLARTPLNYQVWAIVLGSAVIFTAVAGMVASRETRRVSLVAIGATAALTIVLMVGVFLESWDAIQASMGTLYPGARVATGGPNGLQEIFGATSLRELNDFQDAQDTLGTNQSEISSSFAVCFVWAILLLAHRITYRDSAHRASVYVLTGLTASWFAWSTVEFSALGTHIPLVNLVPSARAADVIGFLGVLLVCLVLPGLDARNGVGFSLLTAGVVAAVAANAGSILRAVNLPQISTTDVWVSSFLLAVVVFTITYRPRQWPGYAAGSFLALLLVWEVNPLLVGLADLRSSTAAQEMLEKGEAARSEGSLWVSDAHPVDTLFTATGVPSLSGRQIAGPVVDEWEKLAPEAADEEKWNRGGSYIWFSWTDEPGFTIENPGPDVILIATSPCTVAERIPELGHVVASRELDDTCLVEESTFTWGGAERWVYSISR